MSVSRFEPANFYGQNIRLYVVQHVKTGN